MKYWTKRELVEAVSGKEILAGERPEWLKELEAEGAIEIAGGYITVDIGISSCQMDASDYLVMKDGGVGIMSASVFLNNHEVANN